MRISTIVLLALFLAAPAVGIAQSKPESPELTASIQQLRDSVGTWSVTTRFLNDDGSVAKSATGRYRFEWVEPDRVLSGTSEIPEMKMKSAILFYVNESAKTIEMASVGKDGKLWVMTGPLGGEVRTTAPFPLQSGKSGQLRFTRFNVTRDGFESKMEYTEDGGATWKPGNHQSFRRER